MTEEKSGQSNQSENPSFETDPPGHLGEDTTIVLRNADEDQQSANKVKPQGRALGTTIGGHYKLESRIGSGGSSAVYLATDLSIGRKVAVKLLLSGAYFSDEERLRFQREGRAVGALDHPHIVRIFEFNTTENEEPFLVMEYLQGMSLADIVKERGVLSIDEFICWTKQVAQALGYAHKHGIVHRDVKSSNIVIVQNSSGENIAKVVDFGLARPEEEAGKGLTLTGTIFGSPHYMSPEQCRGERVDARSDIYSLGCVMYECLNGRVPFEGQSMLETFRMHLEDLPRPFAAKLKSAQNAADIEKIVFKCLAKNPSERYQDIDRLEQDLKALEKHARSGILAEAGALTRKLKSEIINRFGKFTRPATVVVLIAAVAGLVLVLKPQIITDMADEHWTSLDLKAQHAFDDGDLVAANAGYDDALRFAFFAPVTKRGLREKESLIGKLDLTFAGENAKEKKTLSARVREIESRYPSGDKLPVALADLMQSIGKLKAAGSEEEKRANAREAAYILNSANDAAEIMIQDGHLLEASDLLQSAFDKTSDYIPESDQVIPRSLLNLVVMFINSDPQKSFIYLTRSHNILQEKSIPPLARARFLSDLGRAYLLASHPEKSIPPLNEAIEIYRYDNALGGLGAGMAFLRLAESEVRLGRAEAANDALVHAERAFDSSERSAANDLRCALTRAEILLVTGNTNEAMAILTKQLDGQERRLPKHAQDLTEALYWNARLLMKLPYDEKNAKRIKTLSERCCAIWERSEHIAFAGTMALTLADYQASNHKLVDAEKSYRRAIQLCTSMRSVDLYSKVSLLNNLGEILMRRAQFQEAYDTLKRSEVALNQASTMQIGAIVGIQPATIKYLYTRLAECAERLGKRDEARKYTEMVESSF